MTSPTQPRKPSFWASSTGIVIIVFAALVFVAALFVFAARVNDAQDRAAAEKMRVEVTSCTIDGLTARVGLRVTNTGDAASPATVQITYRDTSGARVDTDTAYIRAIAPGDTAAHEEVTLLDAAATGGTCGVAVVS